VGGAGRLHRATIRVGKMPARSTNKLGEEERAADVSHGSPFISLVTALGLRQQRLDRFGGALRQRRGSVGGEDLTQLLFYSIFEAIAPLLLPDHISIAIQQAWCPNFL